MSRDSKRSTNERLKYGICLNDECSMCKSKEIQSVPMRKDLLCSECGKELRECPPPKKKRKLPLVIIITVVVVVIIAGLFFVINDKKENVVEENVAAIESPIVNELPVVNEITQIENSDTLAPMVATVEEIIESETVSNESVITETPVTSGNGELTLSYGKYSGEIKDGYPHGQGKLTYTKARVINRHDMKAREAKPGNYVIGEFYNGFVVYGKLYDANGSILSSLNFGVSNEDSYESK